MIGIMADKKRGRRPLGDEPKPRNTERHKKPREAFHLDIELRDALDEHVESLRPRPSKTQVIVTALEEYLKQLGKWPPPRKGGKE